MAKIGEGYFQFSSRGLKELVDEINNAGKTTRSLTNIGKSQGFFSESINKDLGALRLLIKETKAAKKVVDQLKSVSIGSSFAADSSAEAGRARLKSSGKVAKRYDEATIASPTAMAAEKQSEIQRRKALDRERIAIRERANLDPSTTPAFKARVDAASKRLVGGGTSPTELRDKANRIRAEAKGLGRFKNSASTIKEMNDLADATDRAAEGARRLIDLQGKAKSLTPEAAGKTRGSIRDELRSGERADAISARQAEREIESTSGGERIGRRLDEIKDRKDLTEDQENKEIGLASKEVAESLRNLAQDIRESGIDEELSEAAGQFKKGKITDNQFKAAVDRADSKQAGAASAGKTIDDAVLRAENDGQSKDTIARSESILQLTNEIKKLEAANRTLSGSEKEKNAAVTESLKAELSLQEAHQQLSKELDASVSKNKLLLATKAKLDVEERKGLGNSKQHKEERKKNNKELKNAADLQDKLRSAMGDGNAAMSNAARASRRWNFQLQQASYGIQDFVQVIGQTGLSGALRASANNMASFFGAMGTPTGAIIGGLGTIAMIGIAEAFATAGDEAETTEEKVSKLADQLDRIAEIRMRAFEFSAETSGLDSSRLNLDAFASRSSSLGENSLEEKAAKEKGQAEADTAISELSGSVDVGFWGNAADAIGRVVVDGWDNVFNVTELNVKKVIEKKTNARGEALTPKQADAAAQKELEQQYAAALQKIDADVRAVNRQVIGKEEPLAALEQQRKRIVEAYARIKASVVDVDAATAEGAISIAAALEDSEALERAKAEIKAIQTRRLALIHESEEALKLALTQISDFLEGQVRQIGRGDTSSLKSATSSLTGQLQASESREAKNRSQKDNMFLDKGDRDEAERKMKQEEELQKKLVQSLGDLTAAVTNAPLMSSDGLRTAAQESRVRGERVANAGNFGNALSQIQKLSSEREDAMARRLQQRAIINDPGSTAVEAWTATIEAARLDGVLARTGNALADLIPIARNLAHTFGNTDRLIGSQASRDATANRFGSFQSSQQQISPFIKQIEDSQTRLRNAQRVQGNSTDPTDLLVAGETIRRETRLIAELTGAVNSLTTAANGIPSSLSGISGAISQEIGINTGRRLRNEEAVGPNADFNKQNTQASIKAAGDAVLGFSGKVERRLGETQDVANKREFDRLQKIIDEIKADGDKDNDKMIPIVEMAQRKIGTDKDSQSLATVTPIEGLHQKIQESLSKDNSEFDLQEKQKDLLAQIAANTDPNINLGGDVGKPPGSGFAGLDENGLPSNVDTDTKAMIAKANEESLKFAKNSSDKLTELVALLRSRETTSGILIG